jgi:hypothetical protein
VNSIGGACLLGICLLASACSPAALAPTPSSSPSARADPTVVCNPTVAQMTPPSDYVEFLVGGSSKPEQSRAALKTANFMGNEAMWLVLPDKGEMVGRLFDKFLPWRTKPGELQWEARRLDGTTTVARHRAGPEGYGDIGFQAAGVDLPEYGCWQVTYTLNDQYPLQFVLLVRP